MTRFLGDRGFEVARYKGLKCPNPIAIAEVGKSELRRHLMALDGDDIDAIVQIGTNLSMARLALEMTETLAKPVIAINTATYWHTLRSLGIDDQMTGFGVLLAEH